MHILGEFSAGDKFSLYKGAKRYELANHLGNVLSVVSDELDSNGEAIVLSAKDYYPFGMSMPSRVTEGGTYRYGFNGKETDPETDIQDYGMRWYLPNIARFPSVDPLTVQYPWYTPYQFAGNMPIWAVDLDGAEELKFSKQIEGSVIGREIIKIIKHTQMFQDFEKLVAKQKGINVYIFAFKAEQYENDFNTDGFTGGGQKGFTRMFDNYQQLVTAVDAQIEADEAKVKARSYSNKGGIKNIELPEVQPLFDNGKKVITIRICENYLKPNDYMHDPSYLETLKKEGKNSEVDTWFDNAKLEGAFGIIHEAVAHAENRIKGIKKDLYDEHKDFNGVRAYESPDIRDVITKSKSFGFPRLPMIKAVIQIQKSINELYNKQSKEKK